MKSLGSALIACQLAATAQAELDAQQRAEARKKKTPKKFIKIDAEAEAKRIALVLGQIKRVSPGEVVSKSYIQVANGFTSGVQEAFDLACAEGWLARQNEGRRMRFVRTDKKDD